MSKADDRYYAALARREARERWRLKVRPMVQAVRMATLRRWEELMAEGVEPNIAKRKASREFASLLRDAEHGEDVTAKLPPDVANGNEIKQQ